MSLNWPKWIVLACLLVGTTLETEPSGKPADEAPLALDGAVTEAPQGRTIDEMLLFFPAKYPIGNWKPTNLTFRDIEFESKDKTRLHGWFCPCDKPRAIILVAHGNAGNVAGRAPWLAYLQSRLRVSTFMFDYRGYGRSEGVPSVEGVLNDARSAMTKLGELTKSKDSDIVVMGDSLGGAVAVQLAAERAPRALVLQSTFSSLHDVANVHYPSLSWLVPTDKLNSEQEIAKYKGPLLLSHGSNDARIPFALGQKLFKAANPPKQIVAIAGADHNNWLREEYLRQLSEFLEKLPAGM